MKWRLMLAAAVFVIFGIPLLVINLGALGMQAKFENLMGGETSVPGPLADAGGVVLGVWSDFREDRVIDALFVEDRFTRRRSITYTEDVSVGDLLREGETAPGPELEELWVLARASQRALEMECPVVLETIGRACAVSSAEVDETPEESVYRIEAVVGYLPDHPLGDTSQEGPRELYRVALSFPTRGGIRVRPEAAAAAKRSLYLEVERRCDTLRENRGNCVIADLELKSRRPAEDGTVEFYATAGLYTVAPKGDRPEGVDLVGTYGTNHAVIESAAGEKLGLLAMLGGLFGNGGGASKSGDGPSILRGGHNRYGGNDGRFIAAPKP